MIVKWVCSKCGSNNIDEDIFIHRCGICGKMRIWERLVEVDTTIADISDIRRSNATLKIRSNHTSLSILLTGGRLLQWMMIVIIISSTGIALKSGFESNLPLNIVFGRIVQNAKSMLQAQKLTPAASLLWSTLTGSLLACAINLKKNLAKVLIKTAWSVHFTNICGNIPLILMHFRGVLQNFVTNSSTVIHRAQQFFSNIISTVKCMVDCFLQMFLNIENNIKE